MADQTVSLKLDADASGLKSEVQESGEAIESMAGTATESSAEIEAAVTGASSAWEDHAGVINGVAASAGALGAVFEGFARGQQDTNAALARTAAVTGESTDALRDSAVAMSDHTFATADAIDGMERLTRSGFNTKAEFEAILPAVDDLSDATGRGLVESIDSAEKLLLPFGQGLADVADNGDQMTRIMNQTNIPLGTLERNLERVAPELQALEFGLNDAAAGIEVFNDRGLQGREAVREFRRAVAESDGDMGRFLDTMGLSAAEWDNYLEAAAPVPGLMEDTAQANNDQMTSMQRLQQTVENLMVEYGGLAEAAGMISPVIMGAGGLLFTLNQAASAKARLATGAGRLTTALGGTARFLAGPWGIAIAAATGAVMLHARERAAARDRVEELTGAIRADSGALDENTRQTVANRLETEGVLEAADRLGLSLAAVTDAALGDADAMAYLEASTADYADTAPLAASRTQGMGDALSAADRDAILLWEAFGILTPELQEAAEAADREAAAMGRAATGTGEHGDAIDGLSGNYSSLSDEVYRSVDSIGAYNDAVISATDPVFAMFSALDAVETAQQAYNDAVEEHGPKSDEANRAATDLAQAVQRAESAALNGELSFSAFQDQLATWVDMGVITAAQAGAIERRVADARGEAENFRGGYDAEFTASGNAWGRIGDLQGIINRIPDRKEVTVSYRQVGDITIPSVLPRAAGGPVWPGPMFDLEEPTP